MAISSSRLAQCIAVNMPYTVDKDVYGNWCINLANGEVFIAPNGYSPLIPTYYTRTIYRTVTTNTPYGVTSYQVPVGTEKVRGEDVRNDALFVIACVNMQLAGQLQDTIANTIVENVNKGLFSTVQYNQALIDSTMTAFNKSVASLSAECSSIRGLYEATNGNVNSNSSAIRLSVDRMAVLSSDLQSRAMELSDQVNTLKSGVSSLRNCVEQINDTTEGEADRVIKSVQTVGDRVKAITKVGIADLATDITGGLIAAAKS